MNRYLVLICVSRVSWVWFWILESDIITCSTLGVPCAVVGSDTHATLYMSMVSPSWDIYLLHVVCVNCVVAADCTEVFA